MRRTILPVTLLAALLSGQTAFAGLKAYWTFDNTVADATGNVTTPGILEPLAAPATFSAVNVPTVGGTHSLNLTGANTRFHVPYQPAIALGKASDFTISMWINPSSAGTSGAGAGSRVFDIRGTGALGNFEGFQMKLVENVAGSQWVIDGNSIHFDDGAGTSVTAPAFGSNFPDNTWHHLALAYNSTTDQARYFINGNPSGPINLAPLVDFASTNDLSVGSEIYASGVLMADNTARSQKFTGHLDELAIFDQLLTDTQIAQLAAGTLLPSEFLPMPLTPEPMSIVLWLAVAAGAALVALRRRCAARA